MTGSILPLRASSTRSRPYFSSAWYLSSGFWSVTRWPPADLLQGLEDVLLGDAERLEQVLGLALDLGQAEQQVLDRDVLVLHPVGLVLGRVEDPGEVGAERRLAAGDLGQGVQALPRPPAGSARG